jgi:hypothetical protein
MTREEAIKVLEMFLHKQCDLKRTEFAYDQNTVWEAVNMASEALEQEPCDDAVSRQAVLDKKELVELEDGQSFYCISPEDVETLQPVMPKQKTGHWIYFKAINTGEIVWSECSECGNGERGCAKRMKYCPNCGCRMSEVSE